MGVARHWLPLSPTHIQTPADGRRAAQKRLCPGEESKRNTMMKTQELAIAPRTSWARRMRAHWPGVRIARMQAIPVPRSDAGDSAIVRARLYLGAITPADVRVELTMGGPIVARDPSAASVHLRHVRSHRDGHHTFEAEIPSEVLECAPGFTVRVVPDLRNRAVVLAPVLRTAYREHPRSAAGRQHNAPPYEYVAVRARPRSIAHTSGGRA